MRSLYLYTELGFDPVEPLVMIQGRPPGRAPAEVQVRPMREEDLDGCEALCKRVHKCQRTGELRDTIRAFAPFVALRGGRIVAYASAPHNALAGHGVAENEADMTALFSGIAASRSEPIGLLLPTRQAGFFRWCLANGFRAIKPMTLMSIGDYQAPRGCWFPSVLY